MAMLTKQAVEEFKAIYERKYGVALGDAEAVELATNLLNLCRIVFVSSTNPKRSPNEYEDNHAN